MLWIDKESAKTNDRSFHCNKDKEKKREQCEIYRKSVNREREIIEIITVIFDAESKSSGRGGFEEEAMAAESATA